MRSNGGSCTVALPVYNRQALVGAAIQSALAQEVEKLEVLVVDNCSEDGTWDVVNSYRDPRIRAVRNERNVGLFGNFNRCLELARTEYLRFLCSDDRLIPGCLLHEIRVLERNPGVALLSTKGREIREDGSEIREIGDYLVPGIYPGRQVIPAALWVLSQYANTNVFNYPSGITIRREAAERAGRFDERFRLVADVDYWFRILMHGDLAVVDRLGCEVTIHSAQESAAVLVAGRAIEELLELAHRWRSSVGNEYRTIEARLYALSILTGFSLIRQGSVGLGRQYLRNRPKRDVSGVRTGVALARLIGLKLLRRGLNRYLQPRLDRVPFPESSSQALT
jgi:hypothetical protein